MVETQKPVILFDGVCSLCNRTVDFVLERDDKEVFLFGSLQSKEAQQILQEAGLKNDLETLVLVKGDEYYLKSEAYIKILEELGGLWKAVSLTFRIVPRPVRNAFYKLISKHRYKIFGTKETCRMPEDGLKNRFISEEHQVSK